MTWTTTGPPPKERPGFNLVAGRHNGLRDLMVIGARFIPGDVNPVHVHEGDEVLRVVSGEIDVRVGDEARRLRKGDVAVVGAGVPHGFRVVDEVVLEVVTAYGIGTFYPVEPPGRPGEEELVEVYRRDMPWGRPPPDGTAWTTDAELQEIVARVRREV